MGLGWLSGGLVAAGFWWLPGLAAGLKQPLWQWDAFAALAGLSGFSLASLAVLVGMSAAVRDSTRQLVDGPEGRLVVRHLLRAVWWWLAPALLALLDVVFDHAVSKGLFLLLLGPALGQGATAFLAFYLFLERYGRPIE